MSFICTIRTSSNYADFTEYVMSADVEVSGPGANGSAKIRLRKQGGFSGLYPWQEIHLYEGSFAGTTETVTHRWFGGFIIKIDEEEVIGTAVNAGGRLVTYDLECVDYNILLDTFMANAEYQQRIQQYGQTTLPTQLDYIWRQLTTHGTVSSTIDAATEVALAGNMSDFPIIGTGRGYAGVTAREIMDERMSEYQRLFPTTRPRYYMGMTDTGSSFGSPTLHVYDGALTSSPAYTFSTDALTGAHKPVMGFFKRGRDGIDLRTRVQAKGMIGEPPYPYIYNSLSDNTIRATYKNYYDTRSIGGVTLNAWQEVLQEAEDGATTDQIAALATNTRAALETERQSFEFDTDDSDAVKLKPAERIALVCASMGLDGTASSVFHVAAVGLRFFAQTGGTIKTFATITAGSPPIELGDTNLGGTGISAIRRPPTTEEVTEAEKFANWLETTTAGDATVTVSSTTTAIGGVAVLITTTASASDNAELASNRVVTLDAVNTDVGYGAGMYASLYYTADDAWGTLLVRVDWYTAAYALVSSTTLYNTTVVADTPTRIEYDGPITPPAGARFAVLYAKYTGSISGVNNVYLYGPRLEPATVVNSLTGRSSSGEPRYLLESTGLRAGQEYVTSTDVQYGGTSLDSLTVGVRIADTGGNSIHLDPNNTTLNIVAANDIYASTTEGTTLAMNDAATNTASNVLTLAHNTSGTPAASYGGAIKFQLETTTTVDQDAARIKAMWTTATHASRVSAIGFETLTGAGALTEQMRLQGNGRLKIGAPTTVASAQLHVEGQSSNNGMRVASGSTVGAGGYALLVGHAAGSTTSAPSAYFQPTSVNAVGLRMDAPASYASDFVQMRDSGGSTYSFFNSTGWLGIGAAAELGTLSGLLHLGASAAGYPSLAITEGTAPSSPGNGHIWHDSTQKVLHTYLAGIKQAQQAALFTVTQSTTLANSTTETIMVGLGIGGNTIPANFFKAGKTLRVRMRGYLSTAAAAGTLRIKIKHGTTVLLDTGAQTVRNSVANRAWEVVGDITCRTTGATGTVIGQGYFQHAQAPGSTAADHYEMPNTATTTIDTTASGALDVTAQWGTADAGNTITSTNMTIEVIN
jgi:hypothetical protein